LYQTPVETRTDELFFEKSYGATSIFASTTFAIRADVCGR
jgi:hypothetical protein